MRVKTTACVFGLALCLCAGTAAAQESGESSGEEGSSSETTAMEGEESSGDEMSSSSEESGTTGSSASGEETMEYEADPDDETDTGEASSGKRAGHASSTNSLVVAPHVGVIVPQAFNDLGSWGLFSLEVGFQPPMEKKNNPLEIALVTRYTQPGASGTGSHPTLGATGGADYSWELTQQVLTLDLVGMYRFPVAESLDVYGLGGPRMNLMKTTMTAEGNQGNSFGEVSETNTEFGLVFGGGVDFLLGPGTLFGELKFGWTNLDQHLTGNANTGMLVFDVGYRFYPI